MGVSVVSLKRFSCALLLTLGVVLLASGLDAALPPMATWTFRALGTVCVMLSQLLRDDER